MDRFAFSLNEGDKTWLEDRSDELDISAAELLRRLITHARESDSPVIHGDTVGDTDARCDTPNDTVGESPVNHRDTLGDTVAENRERLNALESENQRLRERVEALEAGEGGAIAPTPLATDTPGADVEPSDAAVDALQASGWSHGRNREERQRDAAVATWALEVLRERGDELRKADFPLDALDDERKVDTVWLQVIRPALLAVTEETRAVEVGESKQRYRWVGE
jgi:hypothetical protein